MALSPAGILYIGSRSAGKVYAAEKVQSALEGFFRDEKLSTLRDPFTVQGASVRISGSIGIAVYPLDGADAHLLGIAVVVRVHLDAVEAAGGR